MRFLITGAAGFIGSHLTDRLITNGDQVWGVDNLLTGRRDNINRAAAFFEGDITDRTHFYEVANDCKPDVVIHCAASYSDPNLWHRDTDTNIAGTINATLVARHHGAQLVYFQTALPPISSYAISKIAGEQYITLSGVPHLIFRLANIYGPRNVSGPIPTFYKRITERIPCTIVDTTRDIVYIQDLVDCVTGAITQNITGRFDLCSGNQVSIRDQYQAVLAELTGSAAEWMEQFNDANVVSPAVTPPAADDVQTVVSTANCVPGWQASTGLRVGVQAAVDWYRRNGLKDTYTHLALKG